MVKWLGLSWISKSAETQKRGYEYSGCRALLANVLLGGASTLIHLPFSIAPIATVFPTLVDLTATLRVCGLDEQNH